MTAEIKTQLREYAEHVASLSTPVEIERVVSRESLPFSTSFLPRRQRGWKIAVGAAAVVLFVGLLVVVASRLGSEQAPVITEPAPRVTEPVPEPSVPEVTESNKSLVIPPGTLSAARVVGDTTIVPSSIGDFRWVTVQGPPGSVPEGFIGATSNGYLSVGGPDGGIWSSPDGVAWTIHNVPSSVQIRWLNQTGGGLLLAGTQDGSPAAWRTTDGMTLDPVDISTLHPDITGVDWAVWAETAATDTVEFSRWHITGSVDWSQIFGLSAEQIDLCGRGFGSACRVSWDPQESILHIEAMMEDGADFDVIARAQLSVVESDSIFTIEARDTFSGALLHTFSGTLGSVSTDDILATLIPESTALSFFETATYGVSDGTVVEPVSPPWSEPRNGITRLVADSSRLFAFVAQEGGPIEVWTSQDGRSWTLNEVPIPGEHVDTVAARSGVLLAVTATEGAETLTMTMWRSTDGSDWDPIEAPSPILPPPWDAWKREFSEEPEALSHIALYANRDAWMAMFPDEIPFTMLISDDGADWEQVDSSGLSVRQMPVGAGGFGLRVLNQAIFAVLADEYRLLTDTQYFDYLAELVPPAEPAPTVTLWVGTLEGS